MSIHPSRKLRGVLVGAVAAGVLLAGLGPSRERTEELKPFFQEIPSAAFRFEMLPVPSEGDAPAVYMSRAEIPWEAFDVYIYKLDEEPGKLAPLDADVISRPSKPYLPPDRGFGHEGYAAISMSFKNAQGFCAWLSARTGKTYRLATEAEWERAARAGRSEEQVVAALKAEGAEHAWFAENAKDRPHPIGTRKANAWGFVDMHGNVQEWVVGRDGKPVTKGGSYRDGVEQLAPGARQKQDSSWNASDPQIPKSPWWLSDGPFVGFRIVMEPEGSKKAGGQKRPEGTPKLIVDPAPAREGGGSR